MAAHPSSAPSVGSTHDALAKKIADQLFKNGFGDEASRLILEVKGKDGGGWCKQAVVDIIRRNLDALNQ